MADDIQGLDTSPLLRLDIDYSDELSGKMEMFRDVVQFPGTNQRLILYSENYPRTYEIGFLFVDKEEKYNFLQFWDSVRGEFAKFWFITEEIAFELVSVVGSLDTVFIVNANNFHEIFKGNERICIRLRSGDIVIRQIIDVSYDDINEQYTLQTGVTFDRVIEIVDVVGIYFVVPVRFDNEVAKITNQSKVASQCQVTIRELLLEYP